MTMRRRRFKRESEETRRDQLIAAALELIGERGPESATVRAIAERAGVTQGLIRHYFQTKEDLTRAAYDAHMGQVNKAAFAAMARRDIPPVERLALFVAVILTPPDLDPTSFGIWAGFLQMVRRDPAMARVHEANYLALRNRLEELIAELPGPARPAAELRHLGIACNAVLDGLWLEGSAYPEGFTPHEVAQIGLAAVGALLGVDLPAVGAAVGPAGAAAIGAVPGAATDANPPPGCSPPPTRGGYSETMKTELRDAP